MYGIYRFNYSVVYALFGFCCSVIFIINIYEIYLIENEAAPEAITPIKCQQSTHRKKIYVVYGRDVDSGYLAHVYNVLSMFAYIRGSLDDNWDLIWSHDYPFKKLSHLRKNLKSHQKVNHFPGSGYITNKMDLSTTDLPFIPKAFYLSTQQQAFMKYVSRHPKKMFVQKSNDHRGIKVVDINNIMYTVQDSFIQEYIDNPLLVDGYKFDIGVYTILTSLDPLRVYTYNGDALFRYCTERYYPFNSSRLNKYVVGDDYLPTWEIPSLKKYFSKLGFSMKESFNGYMETMDRDYKKIWKNIEEAIQITFLKKEPLMLNRLNAYPSTNNFFEMMRFDFVVDNDLNVFLMEVNMSPNLSSAHFPLNALLYEQVLFNLFSLIGLASNDLYETNKTTLITSKNIVVSPGICGKCEGCMSPRCQLCLHCLTPKTKEYLQLAYLEHHNKKDCKRIFPSHRDQARYATFGIDLSPENSLLSKWYEEKCKLDASWCYT